MSLTDLTNPRTSIAPGLAYYHSPHWQDLRVRKFRESGGWCEVRGCRRRATQLHHNTYARCPWYERLGDLVAVCAFHHQEQEEAKRHRAAAIRRGRRAFDSCGMVRPAPSQMNLPLRR